MINSLFKNFVRERTMLYLNQKKTESKNYINFKLNF